MVSLVPGMTVEIIVSDPWDFGTAHGAGPFKACLTCAASDPNRAMKGTAAVFKLEETRMFRDVKCEYFVAQTRHEGSDLERLSVGEPVNCNLICIPVERALSDNPLDLAWWRGGVSLLASVRKA